MRPVLLVALALICSAATAQAPAGLLVVLNKAEASASLVDLSTGQTVATLPTGVGPHEVAVSADGRTAVVTDYGDQATVGASLTVLDLGARAVTATVPTGEWERPHGIAFLPDGRLAVTAERDSAVAVVDLAAGAVVAEAPTGGAISHMLALSPDGRHVYTANMLSGTVSRIDLGDGRVVATAATGPMTEAVAVRPGGAEVWAASQEDGRVVVLDAATLAETGAAAVGGRPIRIVFTPDGRRALVTSVESSELTVLDAETHAVLGVVALPNGPETANAAAASAPGSALPVGVAVAADGRRAYVALMGRDQVAEVDLETLAVTRYLDVGAVPDGIAVVAVDPGAGRAGPTRHSDATGQADPADVESIDAIVGALYDVISGPASEARDWDRFRALFHPEGRMVPMQPAPGGAWRPVLMSPDTFAEQNAELMRTHPAFQGKGFYETEAARRTERFGSIATVWSTYEGRFSPADETPFLRGINTIDLVFDGERWWVLQILWQQETPDLPLPQAYLTGDAE